MRGSSTIIVRARRVLPRRGRATIAEQITAGSDRRIRNGRIRSVFTTISAANRYGALVSRMRQLPSRPGPASATASRVAQFIARTARTCRRTAVALIGAAGSSITNALESGKR